MPQTAALVDELKRALRRAGVTYRDVAAQLRLSEASVKRLFSQRRFTLSRMDEVLAIIGFDFADLVESVNARREYISELTPEQEDALVSDPKLLVIAFLIVNRWHLDDIRSTFDFSDREIEQRLIRLNRLRMIELLPFNRYRLLTARNFTWQRNGPVQRFFATQIRSEFFDSAFDGAGETLRFLSGALSPAGIAAMQDAIDRLVRQFDELLERDSRLSIQERYSCSAVFAMRPIEYSMFARHRIARAPKLVSLDPRATSRKAPAGSHPAPVLRR
ncbi:MAG: XRE family transcriptional regulator [Woeseiaceae bacterium]